MKKAYQKPQVQTIDMSTESAVLTASGGGIPIKPGEADGSLSPMSVDGGEPAIWPDNVFNEQ